MTTTTKKAPRNGQERGKGAVTTVFLPEPIQQRLARYMFEKYAGRAHVRNKVLLEAIEEKLTREGY